LHRLFGLGKVGVEEEGLAVLSQSLALFPPRLQNAGHFIMVKMKLSFFEKNEVKGFDGFLAFSLEGINPAQVKMGLYAIGGKL
jgi:hypothetical protein